MSQMNAEDLSADHTFKVAANIGIVRDGKWMKMFDSLFLVLNEAGVVMTWLLCKGTKFVSAKESLKLLKQRLDAQGSEIKLIAIDNCCKWSKLYYFLVNILSRKFLMESISDSFFELRMRIIQNLVWIYTSTLSIMNFFGNKTLYIT